MTSWILLFSDLRVGVSESYRLIEGMKFMDYDPSISQYPEDVSVLTSIGPKKPVYKRPGSERTYGVHY